MSWFFTVRLGRHSSTAAAVAAAIAGLVGASAAQAAGFQIQEQSVKSAGNANAGAAAIAEDASTVFYNPAGLTRLQRQTEVGGHIILPQSEFNDQGSTNGVGGQVSGKRNDDGGEEALVPNFYYANPFSERLSFGFGISALYGLATEYDRDWIGRYHAVKSELFSVNINPALGYKINDQFSVGIGVSAQYLDADLTNALDFGTLGFLSGAPVTPSSREFDGFTEVTGDDWGFGFNLGVLYEPNPGTRIGLGFRSEIDHTLEGENELTVPDFAVGLAGPSRTRDASADATTPATVSLSGYHEINARWAIMADITWTEWSSFEELRIEFSDDPFDPDPRDSVQPEEWDDVFRYSIGVNYRYSDALTLRAGFAYDDSPVPRTELRTPRIPDNDRRWVSLGASYRPSDSFSFDVAYTHIFISDTPINDTEVTTGGLAGAPVGNTLRGEYEATTDLIAAQLQWNF